MPHPPSFLPPQGLENVLMCISRQEESNQVLKRKIRSEKVPDIDIRGQIKKKIREKGIPSFTPTPFH
jgi:hypothetical protein